MESFLSYRKYILDKNYTKKSHLIRSIKHKGIANIRKVYKAKEIGARTLIYTSISERSKVLTNIITKIEQSLLWIIQQSKKKMKEKIDKLENKLNSAVKIKKGKFYSLNEINHIKALMSYTFSENEKIYDYTSLNFLQYLEQDFILENHNPLYEAYSFQKSGYYVDSQHISSKKMLLSYLKLDKSSSIITPAYSLQLEDLSLIEKNKNHYSLLMKLKKNIISSYTGFVDDLNFLFNQRFDKLFSERKAVFNILNRDYIYKSELDIIEHSLKFELLENVNTFRISLENFNEYFNQEFIEIKSYRSFRKYLLCTKFAKVYNVITLSKDKKLIAIGSRDHTIRLFSTNRIKKLGIILETPDAVNILKICKNNSCIISTCYYYKEIYIWNLRNKSPKKIISKHDDKLRHDDYVRSLDLCEVSNLMVSGDRSGVVIIWSLANFEALKKICDYSPAYEISFLFAFSETHSFLSYSTNGKVAELEIENDSYKKRDLIELEANIQKLLIEKDKSLFIYTTCKKYIYLQTINSKNRCRLDVMSTVIKLINNETILLTFSIENKQYNAFDIKDLKETMNETYQNANSQAAEIDHNNYKIFFITNFKKKYHQGTLRNIIDIAVSYENCFYAISDECFLTKHLISDCDKNIACVNENYLGYKDALEIDSKNVFILLDYFGRLIFYPESSYKENLDYKTHVSSINVSQSKKLLIIISIFKDIYIFDLDKWEKMNKALIHKGVTFRCLRIASDDSMIATLSYTIITNNKVFFIDVWNVESGKCIFNRTVQSPLVSIEFAGATIKAFGDEDEALHEFEIVGNHKKMNS